MTIRYEDLEYRKRYILNRETSVAYGGELDTDDGCGLHTVLYSWRDRETNDINMDLIPSDGLLYHGGDELEVIGNCRSEVIKSCTMGSAKFLSDFLAYHHASQLIIESGAVRFEDLVENT